MAKRLAGTGKIALWQTARMVSLHDPCPAATRRSARLLHWLAVPLVLPVVVAQADPIDDFVQSPGVTGDSLLAARMFAWCSARYEFSAWLERTVDSIENFRSLMHEDKALGARAAGAQRLYAAWEASLGDRAAGAGAQSPDFSYYLTVVEGMAEVDGKEIDSRLTDAAGQPELLKASVAVIDAEHKRCITDLFDLQVIQIGLMTKDQIAMAKARPRMVSRPSRPNASGP